MRPEESSRLQSFILDRRVGETFTITSWLRPASHCNTSSVEILPPFSSIADFRKRCSLEEDIVNLSRIEIGGCNPVMKIELQGSWDEGPDEGIVKDGVA